MSKIDEFYARPKNELIAQEFELNLNDFHAIHFGAIGPSNGVGYIISAAAILKEQGVENIKIVFLGSGREEDELREKCAQRNITNVRFFGRHPMKIVSEIVNICDVSIVSFANIPILYTNSPNKLFDSLSASKPIIVNSPGWTKEMVEENKCGLYVDPEKPEELANALIFLSKNPDEIAIFSKNSRRLAETTYDKSILCKKVSDIINKFDKSNSVQKKYS
ncbi:MAG: glycosyltransferase family 4 protein [Agriterribacter sp.]